METNFPKEPVCELCRKEPADAYVHFLIPPPPRSAHAEFLDPMLERAFAHEEENESAQEDGQPRGWKFCGECARGAGHYDINLDRFFRSPAATVRWLATLREKAWMDWNDFAAMMDRFAGATGSFGSVPHGLERQP